MQHESRVVVKEVEAFDVDPLRVVKDQRLKIPWETYADALEVQTILSSEFSQWETITQVDVDMATAQHHL
jgi:hypothetical protein